MIHPIYGTDRHIIEINEEEECFKIIDTQRWVGTEPDERDNILICSVYDVSDAEHLRRYLNKEPFYPPHLEVNP